MDLVRLAEVELSDGNVSALISVLGTVMIAIIGLITKILFDIRGNKKTVTEQLTVVTPPDPPGAPRPGSHAAAPSIRSVVDQVQRSTEITASRLDLVESTLKQIEAELHALRYGDNGGS